MGSREKGEGRRKGNLADPLGAIAAIIGYCFLDTHTTSEPMVLLHPKMKATLNLG
jgi:hypothetical protein